LGLEIPKQDQCRVSAEETYDWLMNNCAQLCDKTLSLHACDEHLWPDLTDDASGSSGSSARGAQAHQKELEDSGEGSDSACLCCESGDELAACLDELADQAQALFAEWLPAWGDTALGELRAVAHTNESASVDWGYILSRRVASCLHNCLEERWAPPNRKIAWLYPTVLLPADHEGTRWRPLVLMAIDASGSIAGPVLDRLLAVARSIPADEAELITVSFDTQVYAFDMYKPALQLRGGGGTRFSAIENHIMRTRRYPDLVVVLSDGFAPRPAVRHPDRWFWLITASGTTRYIQGIGRYLFLGSNRELRGSRRMTDSGTLSSSPDDEIPF
jgi:hypothetical protein